MSAAEWIAKRRELLADATEGPWEADGSYIDSTATWSRVALGVRQNAIADDPDAELIADARTSLPLALHALEAVLDRARKIVDEHGDRVYQDNAFTVGAHAAAVAILDDLNAALEAKP